MVLSAVWLSLPWVPQQARALEMLYRIFVVHIIICLLVNAYAQYAHAHTHVQHTTLRATLLQCTIVDDVNQRLK